MTLQGSDYAHAVLELSKAIDHAERLLLQGDRNAGRFCMRSEITVGNERSLPIRPRQLGFGAKATWESSAALREHFPSYKEITVRTQRDYYDVVSGDF